MSYNISMMINTGKEDHEVCEVGNMTSNVSGMWRKALGYPLKDLHGKTGEDCLCDLMWAIRRMKDPKTKHEYEAMNPPNGWGDYESALKYLEELQEACISHPKAYVSIWY